MQRLCKYKLLLANYIKNSTPDHIDYRNLEVTMEIVEKLVRETN